MYLFLFGYCNWIQLRLAISILLEKQDKNGKYLIYLYNQLYSTHLNHLLYLSLLINRKFRLTRFVLPLFYGLKTEIQYTLINSQKQIKIALTFNTKDWTKKVTERDSLEYQGKKDIFLTKILNNHCNILQHVFRECIN